MVKSIRILLAIAAYYDYEIWKMDVKTAFLNGNLEENEYMHNPKVLKIQTMPERSVSCSDPSMD